MKKNDKQRTTQQLLSDRATSTELHLTRRRDHTPFALDVIFGMLKLLVLAVAVIGFAGLGLLYGVVSAYVDTVPYFETTQLTQNDRSTTVFDMNGKKLTTMSAIEYREWVDIEDVPDMLKNAFIAVEDVRFYKHQGVDFKRLISAALEILGDSNSSGGSTITQQLIKNKVLSAERTYKRKIQEAYLALELEKEWEKDSILEAYLNDIYLGGSNYGIVTAAKDYFGKELSELTVRECALLAGLTQNPYRYNPRLNMYVRDALDDGTPAYQRTVNRTNTVLERMYENGYISRDQYTAALTEEDNIIQVSEFSKMYDQAYFIEYAIYDVISCWLSKDGLADTASNRTIIENKLRSGGYSIYTTLDPTIQDTVQNSLSSWEDYPELENPEASVIEEVISDSVTISTIQPQAASVVLDSATGEIRALIGGRNEPAIRKGLNRAYQSYTEVGSSIKPLAVYGPALDNGVSPGTIIPNVAWTIDGWGGENGYPKGGLSSNRTYGPVSVRTGLTNSLNVVAGRLLYDYVGIEIAKTYLAKLGINETQLNLDGPGLALGTSGITPLQMAAAYAAIANNGYYNKPISFTQVIDEEGRVVLDAYELRGASVKVYNNSATAYILVDMLTEAIEGDEGTGSRAAIEGYKVAGKTGTNSDYASVYFAGMTCKYTSVLWIGHDYPTNKLKGEPTGGEFAAPLWQDYMSQIMQGVESREIINATPASLGLVSRTVCPVSGMLAYDACVDYYNYMKDKYGRSVGKKYALITDYFTYDTVPTEVCDMHVSVKLCKVSACIASESCSPDDVEVVTYVLIRSTSPFYKMSDTILEKVFGDSYRKTNKSIADFLAEFPVCSQCGLPNDDDLIPD